MTVGQGGVGLGVGEGGTPRIIKKSLPPKNVVMAHARGGWGGEGDGVCVWGVKYNAATALIHSTFNLISGPTNVRMGMHEFVSVRVRMGMSS